MDAAKRLHEEESLAVLLKQIQRGSLQAFDRFYALAAPYVMGISCKLLQDRMEAEDVCHDVLMTVISEPERYNPSRGSVEAWLAVLAKSRSLDRLRKRSRLVLAADRVNDDAPAVSENDPERKVLAKMETEALRCALREIPGVQRKTIAEAYFAYRSQRELAADWQVPVGTVKSRLRYGLGHLRKAMVRLGWADAEGSGRHE